MKVYEQKEVVVNLPYTAHVTHCPDCENTFMVWVVFDRKDENDEDSMSIMQQNSPYCYMCGKKLKEKLDEKNNSWFNIKHRRKKR